MHSVSNQAVVCASSAAGATLPDDSPLVAVPESDVIASLELAEPADDDIASDDAVVELAADVVVPDPLPELQAASSSAAAARMVAVE
jgi:hypothetical protein